MEIKLIDNLERLKSFLNEPRNTGNIVDKGDSYFIKPDAFYLGVYDGLTLIGVHEVRTFWHSVIEVHPIYDSGFRGKYVLDGHRLFFDWVIKNISFTNMVTMVPDKTRYGAVAALAVGASRIGHMDDAYVSYGEPVGVTLYQLTRKQCEDILNVNN
ncbi:DUF2824 family protein [Providencia sp. PROV113]|uniref:DUF2824 family protein n=1 Tax=Providencia sp. PROV113 TaxID=2949824 RepID=UPI00234B2109|nr:DUF2824 family protein [Providencia sp. PROV113]